MPTYNRSGQLRRVLESLKNQTLAKEEFEVVLVDDGSTDDTPAAIDEYVQHSGLTIKTYYQRHQGPGQARNLGVEKSTGGVIFFCGDDTVLDRGLLEIHRDHHQGRRGTALLGLTLWDESREVSRFMRFIAPAGPQFHYNTIENREDARFNHFYTSNISIEKKWFGDDKFDPRFVYASFEDIELGFRLEKKGLKIVYNPKARVYHSHYYDPESFYNRMYKVGKSLVIFLSKYKGDRSSLVTLKNRYAPFSYFGGTYVFNRIANYLARSRVLKNLNVTYHWYWAVCFHYSRGILDQTSSKNRGR